MALALESADAATRLAAWNGITWGGKEWLGHSPTLRGSSWHGLTDQAWTDIARQFMATRGIVRYGVGRHHMVRPKCSNEARGVVEMAQSLANHRRWIV